MTLADRIVVMKDDYVQRSTRLTSCTTSRPTYSWRASIGEPPMNRSGHREKRLHRQGRQHAGPAAWASTPDIGKYEGREIVFGFRPEAVRLGEADNACVVKCRVELTEMLGDNTNVYITAGDKQAILKVDSHDTPEMDADISFSIPLEDVYLFDAQTENVIV